MDTAYKFGHDAIKSLPVDRDYKNKPTDLELIQSIFKPQNLKTVKSVTDGLYIAVVAGILFGVLHLPIVTDLLNLLIKNELLTYVLLVFVFVIVLWLVQKIL